MEKTKKNSRAGVRPFFFCLAASLMILFGISVFFSSIYIGRAIADPTSGDEAFFIVQDSDGKRWSKLDGLTVFANEEFGGKALIAPGSSGSYAFTVQNIADFPLNYKISFGAENEDGVPLEFRLKRGGEYLLEEWTDADGLADITEDLPNNSKTRYTLEWRWLYNGDDVRDTAVGVKAAETGVPYVLKINYTAEQNGEPVKPPYQGDQHSPNTGDNSHLAFWIALMICSGMTLFLMLILWYRNDDEDEEEA